MSEPKSKYGWNYHWDEGKGNTYFCLERSAGRVVGFLVPVEIHSTSLLEGIILDGYGSEELHIGFFDNPAAGKRAILNTLTHREEVLARADAAEGGRE